LQPNGVKSDRLLGPTNPNLASPAQGYPADMQRAALRGRPADANTSLANSRALAEYASVAVRTETAEGMGQIAVQRFDAYV